MPVGVMIYDVEGDSIIFENQQFKTMVDGEEGRENCRLKSYAQKSEELQIEEKPTELLMSVIKRILSQQKQSRHSSESSLSDISRLE